MRSLRHLSMASNTGRDIIDPSSKINRSIPFIFYPTWLFDAILQLLPSLHGTGTLNIEWMVRPNFNNSSRYCSFDFVAMCNCPISNLIEQECFSSSSWGIDKVHSGTSWDETVLCN